MARHSIPPWPQYAEEAMVTALDSINGFALVAYIPPIGPVTPQFLDRIAGRLYDKVLDVLRAAEFFSEDRLALRKTERTVTILYEDDAFAFQVRIDDASVTITRPGSSFSRFHHWYEKFMPSAANLIDSATSIISEELERMNEVRRQFVVLRAQYRFEFIAYDFQLKEEARLARNTEVIAALVAAAPNADGVIVPSAEVLSDLGRVDWKVSRWTTDELQRRREIYEVEAPGNRAFSALWFTFTLFGETYESVDGLPSPDTEGPARQEALAEAPRVPFDSSGFLSDVGTPYVDFLRNRALGGFLRSLTEKYRFSTTASSLP